MYEGIVVCMDRVVGGFEPAFLQIWNIFFGTVTTKYIIVGFIALSEKSSLFYM